MTQENSEPELARLLNQAWPLTEAGSPEKAVAALAQAGRTGRRWQQRKLIALAVGAAGVLIIAAFVSRPLLTDRPPLVAVITAQAAMTGHARELQVGDRLPAGAKVETAKGGRLELVTRRGSQFVLDESSELTFAANGRDARLSRGRLYLCNRAGEFATIITDAGRIELLGTIINAEVTNPQAVAVTVVQGKARLVNRRGQSVVSAGNRSVLNPRNAPQPGAAANVAAELAWYQGRGSILSDFGDIVYTVYPGNGHYREIWVMHPDGSGKRRLRSFLGSWRPIGGWLPGSQWLLVNMGSDILGWSDRKPRSMFLNYGHSLLTEELWLLNAATGQALLGPLSPGFRVHSEQVSPDGSRLAFIASYRPVGSDENEGGIWLCSFDTGVLCKLADGYFKTPLAWSPDSRYLVLSSSQGYGLDQELIRIDAQTGEKIDLGFSGADAAFSPDGRQLAYCGEFEPSGSWSGGVPTSGSIWVADLVKGSPPRRISPPHEGALHPQWSPDGKRIAYLVLQEEPAKEQPELRTRLRVANADGSGEMTLDDFDGLFQTFAWASSGDKIFAVTFPPGGPDQNTVGVLAISADGSGVIRDLGGTRRDSILPAEDRRQTDTAVAAVQQALLQFATAETAQFEGKIGESRKQFEAAADSFAEISWKYPRAGFIPEQIMRYADEATRRAKEPTAAILHEICKERLDILSGFLWRFASKQDRFPQDLAELRKWMIEVRHCQPEEIAPLFSCPFGTEAGHPKSYDYNPRASAGHLKPGEVLVSCPEHPDLKIAWDKDFLLRLYEVANISQARLKKLGQLP
jgi:Tol biopolymer transport system component